MSFCIPKFGSSTLYSSDVGTTLVFVNVFVSAVLCAESGSARRYKFSYGAKFRALTVILKSLLALIDPSRASALTVKLFSKSNVVVPVSIAVLIAFALVLTTKVFVSFVNVNGVPCTTYIAGLTSTVFASIIAVTLHPLFRLPHWYLDRV